MPGMTTMATRVYCNNLDGTQQSAITMRDAQAPKRRDMRSLTVRGGGGGVWHGVLVCEGDKEGGGQHTGGGCSSCRLIVSSCR